MRPLHRSPLLSVTALLLIVVTVFAAGCGGGGGSQSGDKKGTDTKPRISGLQTPLGLQGTRGVGPNVALIYNLWDRDFDPADIEVEFGWDGASDGSEDGLIGDGVNTFPNEYVTATPAPGGDGTSGLAASPGQGSIHSFVWNSLVDIETGRQVTQDFVYTDTGRVKLDDFGEKVFQDFPGVRIRMRPVAKGVPYDWVYSDAFDVNNNNRPSVTIQGVDIPPEGAADGTVNEDVVINWTGVDIDDDPVTIAVDWVTVPMGFTPDPTTETGLATLEALPWAAATTGSLGEGTADLAASRIGVAHKYSWDSAADAGTVNTYILIRIRPIDGKREVGDWIYADAPFHLDNFSIFTDPDAALAEAKTGGQATLLGDDTVLLTGGGNPEGSATPYASVFFPGLSQTTKGTIAEIASGMNEPRSFHTATRLQDGTVLIVGGGTSSTALGSAEIYDPTTKTFTPVASSLTTARRHHTAIRLRSGDVLIAGGENASGTALDSAEVFRHETGTFEAAGSFMNGARTNHRVCILPDGRILVAGGNGAAGSPNEIEIYDPVGNVFTATDIGNDMSAGRDGMSLTGTLDATWAAIAAGGMASPPVSSLERFDWNTDAWSASTATMQSVRANHMAVLLGDGKIIISGGQTTEAGALTGTADIYDPATDTIDLPNGEMLVPVRDAAVTILTNGRPAYFGGTINGSATTQVQIYTPDGGFNYPPIAQIRTPTSVEPWAFGVRFNWRAIDQEGDPVRIVPQFRIKPSATDDSGALPAALSDKWLPATMKDQTVLGEKSSGLTALSSRKDFVDTVQNPIDAPDIDPGEHLFVWFTEYDIPKGNYDNVFFRILVFGATQGQTADGGRFSITENAPVIARILTPETTSGHIVVPYYLQDSDKGDLARVVWEYGIDLNGDNKIVDTDGESWALATHSSVAATNGKTDSGDTDLVTGADATDPNNEFTDSDGIPWGKKHYLVWDSVFDLGAPPSPRTDIILRATPYDYPPGSPGNESLGILRELSGFTVERDPNGLVLESWAPSVNNSPGGGYLFDGVKKDETIVFNFNLPVDPASLPPSDPSTPGTTGIQVYTGSSAVLVAGYFEVDNSSGKGVVTFHPQAQELPLRTDVLEDNTGYTVHIPAYDPTSRTQSLIQVDNVPDADTNGRNVLKPETFGSAFRTGTGVVTDGADPAYSSITPSAGSSGVGTGSTIVVQVNDRLLHSTVNPSAFQVYADFGGAVDAVISGTFVLQNIVDATGEYSKITFTPTAALPPNASIRVEVMTGLTDLAGNNLASPQTLSFSMAGVTSSFTKSLTEGFDNITIRDGTRTSAYWGTADPLNKGSAIGTGVASKLTGLYDGGNGNDGALDFTNDVTLTSSTSKSEWQLTELKIPSGRKLILQGTKPITLRVQGEVKIDGAIEAFGQAGGNYFNWSTSGTQQGALGGNGGPGGGKGGDVGSYTGKQQTTFQAGHGHDHNGTKGGADAGKGGRGSLYNPNANPRNYTYDAQGGGGGGHATAGEKGGPGYATSSYPWPGTSTTSNAGGSAWGNAGLTNGPEGGGGGAAGGPSVMSYTSNNWYGAGSGAGGGGGGGGIQISGNETIAVSSTGSILAQGGRGGTSGRASAWTSVYPGGGGGGAGGSIFLQGGTVDINNAKDLNVLGGVGGSDYSNSYDGSGGDGGDGRIRIEAPGFSGKLFSGVLATGTAVVNCSGNSSLDWTVSSAITVNTDNGFGAPVGAWNSGAKRFEVNDFTITSAGSITIQGANVFRVHAAGDVDIQGIISAQGGRGSDGDRSYRSTSSGWYFLLASGGKSAGGGAAGGTNGGSTSYVSSIPKSTDGVGTDGKTGGAGAGKRGYYQGESGSGSSIYSRRSGSYTYYYYYYSGSGGGGGGAEDGDDGRYIRRYYWGGRYLYGPSGDGGSAGINVNTLSDTTVAGGGGGGGGANGGYNRVRSTYNYRYSWGPGAGGGAGGGGISICTDGSMHLSGSINVSGGDGGDCRPTSSTYYRWPGAGGAGGGGAVFLAADKGFTWGLMFVDAGGGDHGAMIYSNTEYSAGGDGGRGGIRMVGGSSAPVLPNDLPASAKYGLGTFTGGNFTPTADGFTIWLDSGSFVPAYTSVTFGPAGASAQVFIECAMTDPLTGAADPTNTTGWVDVTGSLASLKGYRWYRVWVKLVPKSGGFPEVTDFTVNWGYDT